MYADDLKLFKCIRFVAKSFFLWNDLDFQWRYTSINRLPFSVEKCNSMSFFLSDILEQVEVLLMLGFIM